MAGSMTNRNTGKYSMASNLNLAVRVGLQDKLTAPVKGLAAAQKELARPG